MELEKITQHGAVCLAADRVREGLALPSRYTQVYGLSFRWEGVLDVLYIDEEPGKAQGLTFLVFPVAPSTGCPTIVSIKFGYSATFRTNLHDGSRLSW